MKPSSISKGQTEASQAQHFDLPKGQPAKFTYNGELRTCRCSDCLRATSQTPDATKIATLEFELKAARYELKIADGEIDRLQALSMTDKAKDAQADGRGAVIEALIQRHASAYVARGAAISDSIIAECKASREALLAALQQSPADPPNE